MRNNEPIPRKETFIAAIILGFALLWLAACGAPTYQPSPAQPQVVAIEPTATAIRVEIVGGVVFIPVTVTPAPTDTPTATVTRTSAPTGTPSRTPTTRPTNTPRPPTVTRTATRVASATRTPTRTPVPPVVTVTVRPSGTPGQGGYARPFNERSIWNSPVGNAPTHPNSAQWIARIASEPYIDIVIDGIDSAWSAPIYYTDANTPRYRVCDTDGTSYCADGVPIPNGFVPSPDGDGKAIIIDETVSPARAWSFWQIAYRNGRYQVTYGAFGWVNITATGDGLTAYEGGRWPGRAAGWSYYAGLITLEEMQAGRIEHALALLLPGQVVSSDDQWPGYDSDGYCTSGCLPMGSRLALDPTLDLESLHLGPGGVIVARAMQEYGLLLGDTANTGGLNVQSFIVNGRVDSTNWRGLLDFYSLSNLPLEALRVVQVNQADFYHEAGNRD